MKELKINIFYDILQKTVAMHETFLCRLASHPIFRTDMNLAIFLEYDKELNVRGKNKKERLFDMFSTVQKSSDELLLSNTLKDVEEFFDNERKFLLEYHTHLKDATHKSDKMVSQHKLLAENYIKISTGLVALSSHDGTNRGNEEVILNILCQLKVDNLKNTIVELFRFTYFI